MRFFIVHGVFGNPQENWFPWLKSELESLGHQVLAPAFPTPEGHSLDNWLRAFEPYKEIADGAIFIAHSMAPAFVLHLIEQGIKPKHCFFVSGFYGPIGDEEIDPLNSTFMQPIDWKQFHSIPITCYYSDNDPYVPKKMLEEFVTNLNAEQKLISGAGHFNKETGYIEFPQLLDDIKHL